MAADYSVYTNPTDKHVQIYQFITDENGNITGSYMLTEQLGPKESMKVPVPEETIERHGVTYIKVCYNTKYQDRTAWAVMVKKDGTVTMKKTGVYDSNSEVVSYGSNIPSYPKKTDDKDLSSPVSQDSNGESSDNYLNEISLAMEMYDDSYIDETGLANFTNVDGIFGLPYQFLPNTDPRLIQTGSTDCILGYEYADRIVSRIPLLMISPGKPKFLASYSNRDKENIVEKIIGIGKGIFDKDSASVGMDELTSKGGRYYAFEYDRIRYYNFVNPMCRIAARYLNIHEYSLGGYKLDQIRWDDFTKSRVRSIGDFGDYTAIPFYLDSDTSITENFSNSTSQSMLASTVNSMSDMGRELNFLLGYTTTATGLDNVTEADMEGNIQNINDAVKNLLGSGNFFQKLGSHLVTVASGGKLIFPEIWADSSFSRSYTCKMKFISPDPSPLSVYLNVLVPLFHLLALVAPQSVDSNPNGYTNPFIIRAMYKGFFNVDMGIITNMSVTKGAECQWTKEGIPTSIEVTIDIKDLYQAMSITSTSPGKLSYDTMNNTALMDYIANCCGINIYKPETTRLIEMWWVNNVENRTTDFFNNIWDNIDQKVQNLVMNIYRRG